MTSNRLFRSRKTRVFGGVAGGLGEYLDIDPVIARLIFVIATFIGGGGLLVYIVMWIVVPEEPLLLNGGTTGFTNPEPPAGNPVNPGTPADDAGTRRKVRDGSLWGGVILIVLGGLFLMGRLIQDFSFSDYWPVILIVIGAGIIAKAVSNNKNNKQ